VDSSVGISDAFVEVSGEALFNVSDNAFGGEYSTSIQLLHEFFDFLFSFPVYISSEEIEEMVKDSIDSFKSIDELISVSKVYPSSVLFLSISLKQSIHWFNFLESAKSTKSIKSLLKLL